MRRFGSIVAVLACLAVWPSLAAAQEIKLALPVLSLESMPIFIAQEQGFLKKRGVDIDVIASRGGGEAMKAYIAGDVQLIATGFPEVGLLRSRGVDVELFFAQLQRVPFALIGRKDRNITSVADLKGRTVAVTSPGSLTWILTRYFIKLQGMDPDRDVVLVSVGGGGEILGALQSNRADAAMVFEPFITIALQQELATVVVDVAAQLDAFSSAPLVTSKAFVEKSPKEAQAIVDALTEALNYLHSEKEGTLQLAQKKFPGAKPEVLKAALDRMERIFSRDGKFSRGNVERTQQICKDLGIIPQIYSYAEVVAPTARE
ncbi:MAG: ABC transporter substrate-binding protein [Xanthobacteraceae bacterium]